MSNVWYAIDTTGQEVAEFLSRDYDADKLVAKHGAVTIFDRSDGGRWITAIRPQSIPYSDAVRAVVDQR